jgi:enolase
MPDGPNKVIQSSREVLEHKLLTALDDEGTVAILASKEDLDLLIEALHKMTGERAEFWRLGMEQLRRETFGK